MARWTSRFAVPLLVVLAQSPGPAFAGELTKLTMAVGGLPAAGDSELGASSISANGKVVVFESNADNLVPADGNGTRDAFAWIAKLGHPVGLSVRPGDPASDGASRQVVVSGNGKVAAFRSDATTFAEGDENGASDVFVRNVFGGPLRLASVNPDGVPGDGASRDPALSLNGRIVAFSSVASDLVAGDVLGVADVFVRDLKTGVTTRVSLGLEGAEADGASGQPVLSANGRFVAFESAATNLVAGDGNGAVDVFLHDRKTGVTQRVSLGATGGEPTAGPSSHPSIDAAGRRIAFASSADNLVDGDANGFYDVYLRDIKLGTTVMVSVGPDGQPTGSGSSILPSISASGRLVGFRSDVPDLVANDGNGKSDLFVRDLKKSVTSRVSVSQDGTEGDLDSLHIAVAKSGRQVAMATLATTLLEGDDGVDQRILLRDGKTGACRRLAVSAPSLQVNSDSFDPHISANGEFVAFMSMSKVLVDPPVEHAGNAFVCNVASGEMEVASVNAAGEDADNSCFSPVLSGDGRYVVWSSNATNLVSEDSNGTTDVFMRDRKMGLTSRVSVGPAGAQATGASNRATVSADGRYVAFDSAAADLVEEDGNAAIDVFVRDLVLATTVRVSVSSEGVEGDNGGLRPAISGDGRWVAFISSSPNLIADDGNGASDVFLHDLTTGETRRISVDSAGTESAGGTHFMGSLSHDGRYVSFLSGADDLVADDGNGQVDAFVHDRVTGEMRRVSVSSLGVESNGDTADVALSADGSAAVFESAGDLLVEGDGNGAYDVFLHVLATGETRLLSVDAAGVPGNNDSFSPAVDAEAKRLVFASEATSFVPDDTIYNDDIFLTEIDD